MYFIRVELDCQYYPDEINLGLCREIYNVASCLPSRRPSANFYYGRDRRPTVRVEGRTHLHPASDITFFLPEKRERRARRRKVSYVPAATSSSESRVAEEAL